MSIRLIIVVAMVATLGCAIDSPTSPTPTPPARTDVSDGVSSARTVVPVPSEACYPQYPPTHDHPLPPLICPGVPPEGHPPLPAPWPPYPPPQHGWPPD